MTKIQRNKQTILHLLKEMTDIIYTMRLSGGLINKDNPSAEIHFEEEYATLTEAFFQLAERVEPDIEFIKVIESEAGNNDNDNDN